MDDLDHHLPWIDRCEDVLAESLLLDLVGEVSSYVVVDVGIE